MKGGERDRVLGVVEETSQRSRRPNSGWRCRPTPPGASGRAVPRYHGWGLNRSTVHRVKETLMAYQFA